MSTLPSKEITGDIAVTRNVAAGGDAVVQGSVHVGHDLKVEGWLEARNIKAANKGIFTEIAKLRAAYPNPHDGWFAGVGTSSPFALYTAENGEWFRAKDSQGNLATMEVTIDNQQVNDLADDLDTLEGNVQQISETVSGHTLQIQGINSSLTTVTNTVNNHTGQITALNNMAATAALSDMDSLMALSESSDYKARVYKILNGSFCVGWLFTECSAPTYGFGQIFLTHYRLTGSGEIDTSVNDAGFHIYRRFFARMDGIKLAATGETLTGNTWSKWYVAGGDELYSLLSSVGQAGGVAPLDDNIEVPAEYIPTDYLNVVRFAGFVENVTVQEAGSAASGTVVFNSTTNRFVAQVLANYYGAWEGSLDYGTGTVDGVEPSLSKLYIDTSSGKLYRWSGSKLEQFGADVESQVSALTSRFKVVNSAEVDIDQINVTGYYWLYQPATAETEAEEHMLIVTPWTNKQMGISVRSTGKQYLVTNEGIKFRTGTWYNNSLTWTEWSSYNELISQLRADMQSLSPLGNDYNVTNVRIEKDEQRNTEDGSTIYDTLETAIKYASEKKVIAPGFHLTFAIAPKSWKSYVYVGMNTEEANIGNLENWQDLAGLSAGDEPVININTIAPAGGLNGFYSLDTALTTLRDYEKEIGITYRKKNLIITYRTADGKTESKQYKGDELDATKFYVSSQWIDFGKGSLEGIKVNGAAVEPESDGTVNIIIPETEVDTSLDAQSQHAISNAAVTDQFDTIRAINSTGFEINGNDDDGYTLDIKNADGDVIESLQLPFSTGGGGGESQTTDATKIVLQAQITDGSDEVSYLREGAYALLRYTFGHQYSTGDNAGQETGASGTLQITVKNGFNTTYDVTLPGVSAGSYDLDLTNILRSGGNTVTIAATVLDPVTGKEKYKQITKTVNVRKLSMTSGYDLQNSIKAGGYKPDETAVIPFSCQATGKKDIHVVIDGTEDLTKKLTDYSATTGEIRVPMSTLALGRHNVQIYATQSISGLELQSETIFVDILKCDALGQNSAPFIGTKMILPSGTVFMGDAWREPTLSTPQFAQLEFDFVVYDPDNIPATLLVSHDGVVTQTISANRAVKTYSNRFTKYGRDEMRLECGACRYNIHVDVTESSIDIAEVSDSVLFKLSASGRSNSEKDPGQWSYEGITSEFTGFDWLEEGSGWTDGTLKLMNGARVNIGYPLLAQNAATNGLTFEVEVRCTNVVDRSGVVIDCMNAAGVGMRVTTEEAVACMDGGEKVSTKFAAGEWIRIAFAVEKSSADQRLLSIYINGRRDRSVKFDATSAMMNANNFIGIRSDAADVEVRALNAFGRCLTEDEVLNNRIAGTIDTDEMVVLFDNNNVLDDDKTDIDIEKMRKKGKGVLLIKGSAVERLSDLNYRNDKSFQMRVDLEYYSPYGDAYNFRATGALIQIQGTSSVTYTRKNYNILFDSQTTLWINGIKSDDNLYSFKPGARPVSIFCLKADFCDSSGTHNTGACTTINDLMRKCGWLTPPQAAYQGDMDVRIGIDGFPITLYNDDEGTGVSTFIGKYNFNNEKKGSGIVYGFEGIEGFNDEATLAGNPNPCICLEFLENGQPLGLFQNADFDSVVDAKGTCAFDKALEFRFPNKPDGSKLKWAQATDYQKTAISRLWSWVASCKGNPDKFRQEYDQYFGNEGPFVQYVISDYFMAVDDRAKNMMLATWDGIIWYFLPYDWDCLFGEDNTSHLKYDYDIDENSWDVALSNYAFAGHDSDLWELVRACPDKLGQVAGTIRANLSVTAVKAAFSTVFEDAWSERVYNRDARYKYITPAFVDIEQQSGEVYGDYLFALQGSRKSHRNYIIDNRFALLDSLYGIGDFRGNAQKVYLYGEFATDPRDITITAFEKFGFGYGSNNADLSDRATATAAGEQVTLTVNSNLSANDPQNIYGADRIEGLDLTDIADSIVSTLTLSACKRLRDLDLTNSGNEALTQLDVTGCRILRTAKVDGMNALRSLDLSKNRKLETLKASDTKVTSVSFATGAVTTTAALPSTLQSLVMVGLPNLTLGEGGLTCEGWGNMVSLQAEQMGALNPVALLRSIIAAQPAYGAQPLQRVKIGGASTRGDGSELLALIERGVVGITNSTKPEVNGTYQLDSLENSEHFSDIEEGIDGITLVLIVEAFISSVDAVNAEQYAGMDEVTAVTMDNIGEHIEWFNGETYAEWLAAQAESCIDLNELVKM